MGKYKMKFIDLSMQAASTEAYRLNKDQFSTIRQPIPGEALARALEEARKPLSAMQERVKARVEAQGLGYAVNGEGVGYIYKKGL